MNLPYSFADTSNLAQKVYLSAFNRRSFLTGLDMVTRSEKQACRVKEGKPADLHHRRLGTGQTVDRTLAEG